MLAWDHNAYYHRALLRRVPPGASRVLEAGCGRGQLAARLAARVDHVVALDRDAEMVAAARAVVPANVTCVYADVMQHPVEPAGYDAVVSLSVLHHLDLQPALSRLAGALRPGGVLAVVALPRVDLPRDLPVEVAATAWHHLLGAAFAAVDHPLRTAMTRGEASAVPMRDPELTTAQVGEQARAVLPGVGVRRLLLWRYLLTWRRPTT